MNYQLGRTLTQSGFETYNGTTELGVNLGRFLLLDNRNYTNSTGQSHATRLQTQLIYDRPEELQRWTFGDAAAASGELGGSFNFAGIGVSKLYQINPYFVKQPLAGFSGAVALPSTVEIYANGARVQTQTLAPGNFNLQNLNFRGATGLSNLEYVIRDPFGREQRISSAYFFSDQLLARGLHEYSYNAGVMRRNYGVTNSDYGTAAFSAFHRYGLTDTLTLGVNGDATAEHFNIGPRASLNTVRLGIVTAGLAVSHDNDISSRRGAAGSLNHSYQSGAFSTSLLARRFSEDFSVLTEGLSTAKPKLQGAASVSYGSSQSGTFSLGYSTQTAFGAVGDQHSTTLGYTRTLFGNVSLVANVSRVVQDTRGYAAFIGLSFFPGNGLSANLSHQKSATGDTLEQLQFAKTVPTGEGLGYRVVTQRSTTAGTVSESVSPFVQYNATHAILTAEGTDFTNGGAGGSGFYRLSVAGAAAVVGDGVYFSRPVNDSYGVVKVEPPLAGVRVMRNNAAIGTTGASGAVFIPNLGSYQVNDVAIQPKDVPLDYTVTKAAQKVRPPLRAGVVAAFNVVRVRAITGILKLRRDGTARLLENVDIELTGDKSATRLITIRGGDFYIENLQPGRYTGSLKVDGKSCSLQLTVADTNEIVTDLGDVFCESLP